MRNIMHKRRNNLIVLFALLALLAGCVGGEGGSGSTSTNNTSTPVVDSVTNSTLTLKAIFVKSPLDSAPLGVEPHFDAVAQYSDDTTKPISSEVVWELDNDSKAEISNTGILKAKSIGKIIIRAKLGDLVGEKDFTITEAELKGVKIFPEDLKLSVGDTQGVSAIGTYTDGRHANITALAKWSSDTANIALNNQLRNADSAKLNIEALTAGGSVLRVTVADLKAETSVNIRAIDDLNVKPLDTYAYIANEEDNSITSFKQNSNTGALEELQFRHSIATKPAHFVANTTKNYGYMINHYSSLVSRFDIASDGKLLALGTNSPDDISVLGPDEGFRGVLSHDGNMLYATGVKHASSIYQYHIDNNTGKLASAGRSTSPICNGRLFDMKLHPILPVLYTVDRDRKKINSYNVNDLGEVNTACVTVSTEGLPGMMAINLEGTLAYVANRESNSISMYKIDKFGELKPLAPAAIHNVGLNSPQDLTIAPNGKFLYVVNYKIGSISVFAIKEDGQLEHLPDLRTQAAMSGPHAISFDPSGKWVYAVDHAGIFISQFTWNKDTGSLKYVGQYNKGGRFAHNITFIQK